MDTYTLTIPTLNETHNPETQSWVQGAQEMETDFPIQNLPLCVFRAKGSHESRIGVAIGSAILDLHACASYAVHGKEFEPVLARALLAPTLNELMKLSPRAWSMLRRWCWEHLRADHRDARKHQDELSAYLHPREQLTLMMPAAIGDYTDFYASVYHATNVGAMFRPDNPLLPNYKHVPIGYHGRASSVIASGEEIVRPHGQIKGPDAAEPSFTLSASLDYEVELGAFIGGHNARGESVPIGAAWNRLFGFTLLNDWSARDVQAWEYQPLGPFLAKNFATTISPFVVTAEALLPFRVAAFERDAEDPKPCAYLYDEADQQSGGLDLEITVSVQSEAMRKAQLPPMELGRCATKNLYWTYAQFVAHHTCNGCNLLPGDLIASGTISGPTRDSLGCMLELTQRGKTPVTLPTGETRVFLADGDEVLMTAKAKRAGARTIGFGSCQGRVGAAF